MFYELCVKEFSDVLSNENIFNGWDADIILTKEKVAVLWNGIWHYKKITKKHSLIQVQNRDIIKLKEIKSSNNITTSRAIPFCIVGILVKKKSYT